MVAVRASQERTVGHTLLIRPQYAQVVPLRCRSDCTASLSILPERQPSALVLNLFKRSVKVWRFM